MNSMNKTRPPKEDDVLRRMLMTAMYCGHPAALRYPRGNGLGVPLEDPLTALPIGKAELLREGDDLLLCALGGLTYAECAAVTGVPEGTVASRINRARRQLAVYLTPEGVRDG